MPTKTNISGFPEFLPAEQMAFDIIVAKITAIYQSFGYVPLETAAVERIETLTSKGIDSKEVYALRRLNAQGDDGDKDIALRFDLTVPLARYVSQNYANLIFPYRRYQVQPVFRGERPQLGRYRQFHQFDLDVLTDGANSLPLQADAEIIAAAWQALTAILPEGTKFTMRVNNRKLLLGLVEGAGYEGEQIIQAVKVIDDREKISDEQFAQRLIEIRPSADINTLISQISSKGVTNLIGLNAAAQQGAEELQTVLTTVAELTNNAVNILPDLTIARGLDYYTGTVVETRLEPAPELGSICSGGRYDNLTASLSDRNLPGVGVSIGVSRLAAWLMSQPPYNAMAATSAKVIVTGPNAASICQMLRAGGIPTEQALGEKSAGQHFQTAQKRGIAYGIVADDSGIQLRTFETRASETVEATKLVAHLQKILAK